MSKICSYAQGFAQMRAASEEYNWNLQYGEIAMIFRGGCIIRAQFLQRIKDAYDRDPALKNLLLDPYFKEIALKLSGSITRNYCLCGSSRDSCSMFLGGLILL